MKNKKIKNMTRAEHKRALQQAVGLQAAAIREAGGQLFLPSLKGIDGDIYTKVVSVGKELFQKYNEDAKKDIQPTLKKGRIISYYSRKDIQNEMFNYAYGRKISVLRNFSPMFGGSTLREPGDILPIMLFYSQEANLWPSIHGTITRKDGNGGSVCDFVVEIDCKKSMVRAFNLSRPIIKLFQELGIEFRLKFSGNSSPHIIIPAEAFPKNWRRDNRCRGLYGKILDYLRNKIKEPKMLDGSFRNPGHFLRLPYSLNENTGLVSVPMKIEDFDRFSWEMARPEAIEVINNWWTVPEDAPEHTEVLIDLVFDRRKTYPVSFQDNIETFLTRTPDILGEPMKMGIIVAGQEMAARYDNIMGNISIKNALEEIAATDYTMPINQLVNTAAEKHGVNKGDLSLLWNWKRYYHALAHYSRLDIQEAIVSYVQGRYISLEGMDDYIKLNDEKEVSAFAEYMVGGGFIPKFWNTNACYTDDGEIATCDIAIKVDKELANSAALLFRSFEIPCFALYSGDAHLWIIMPYEIIKPLSRVSDLANSIGKYLRRALNTFSGVSIFTHEVCVPSPYSIADDGISFYLPAKLEEVYKLSPETAYVNNIVDVKTIGSFTPLNENEKMAEFFNKIIF